jgi:magnesium chelatase family protein
LTVEVPAMPPELLSGTAAGERSLEVRARVQRAREMQRNRQAAHGVLTNSQLSSGSLAAACPLDAAATRVLTLAARRLGLSARGYDRVRKVARTIADLAGADSVSADDVAEALQFRL